MKPFAFLALFLFALAGYPCSCSYPSFQEQVADATAIFSGKVTSLQPAGENKIAVRFETKKSYKGAIGAQIEARTPETTEACGYTFELNREYLVYATGRNPIEVSLCSRTKLLKDATADIDKLKHHQVKAAGRDPFVEMRGEKFTAGPKPVPKALTITNAVIAGITKKSDGYVALVRATDNKVYFLKAGDKLHDGIVVRIDSNEVTFRQYQGNRSVLVKKQLRPFPD